MNNMKNNKKIVFVELMKLKILRATKMGMNYAYVKSNIVVIL
jgi:hypothetical protein